ncbi:MAG: hypothetical protein Ta2D_09630 [Rickettsiales bacterium]|nr:MAG: hypothetical protein Ta2D_09630 [Rickettsiales bacterium]
MSIKGKNSTKELEQVKTADISNDYLFVLESIKNKIKTISYKVNIGINTEMIILYWHIGNEILQRQKRIWMGQ